MIKRGKIVNKLEFTKLHRFSEEKITVYEYANTAVTEHFFYSRKDNRQVSMFNDGDCVLYINTRLKDDKNYSAAINESKRLTKAEKFSEYLNI